MIVQTWYYLCIALVWLLFEIRMVTQYSHELHLLFKNCHKFVKSCGSTSSAVSALKKEVIKDAEVEIKEDLVEPPSITSRMEIVLSCDGTQL